MKFGLSRRRGGRRGDGATISHKGPYVRHLNFNEHSRSDYSGIVEPFTNEIEECVQELCLKDITTETESKLACEWVSMKQRVGRTPSLLQKDTRGLSGIAATDVAKLILKKIRTLEKQHREERETIPLVARSAQSQWYISNGVAEDLFDTTQHIVPDQDFVRYGLVVDVTWRTVHDGDIFEFRKQYGGFIPYVLDLESLQEDMQIRRARRSADDDFSGLTVGSSDSANASLKDSQRSEDERFGGPRRARRLEKRARSVDDSSSSMSNVSRISRFTDMIREFQKPVRFATDKLSSYFEPSVLEQQPSRSADTLDRNSSDRESSQANRRMGKEGNQRRWMRPIGRALRGVADTLEARGGHSNMFVIPGWTTSGRAHSLNNSRQVEPQVHTTSGVNSPAPTIEHSTERSSSSSNISSARGTMTPRTSISGDSIDYFHGSTGRRR